MKDEILAEGKWTFGEEVAEVFDDMLPRSIPDYATMRKLIYILGRDFARKGAVVDLGCSLGESFKAFANDGAKVYGFEVSMPMVERAKKKFSSYDNVYIEQRDCIKDFPRVKSALTLSVLTAQFTPIEYRHKFLRSIYETLSDGGALIYVEKILGKDYELDSMLVDAYYSIKEDNAYTQEQIAKKRKSLEGVLVPVTAKWNEELLRSAGFDKVECFWRCLNFAGWIAIKKGA